MMCSQSVTLVHMEKLNNLKFIADSETLRDINPLTFFLSDGS